MYVREDQRKKRSFPCTRFCIDNLGAKKNRPSRLLSLPREGTSLQNIAKKKEKARSHTLNYKKISFSSTSYAFLTLSTTGADKGKKEAFFGKRERSGIRIRQSCIHTSMHLKGKCRAKYSRPQTNIFLSLSTPAPAG